MNVEEQLCYKKAESSIKVEINNIRNKYLNSAHEIVGAYQGECQLSNDYAGRQLFELLQNADDAAGDVNLKGKVKVTFDGRLLSISNTGAAFSVQGIKSLLYPNASPKKTQVNKIGCKGLGFRSILNWSHSLTISTKEFTIQFSKENAKNFLLEILKEKPSLKQEIQLLTTDDFPIAVLTSPNLINESALEDGFDTSIIMECFDEVIEEIETQIKQLKFEELVFLPNLEEVEIICNEYHKIFSKEVDGSDVIIETVDKTTDVTENISCWKLYKKTGVIEDENGKDKNYEFIIAYDPEGEHKGEVLYSYFKTDIKLGFPALIHGTFELTGDRNSLSKQSIVNKKLIPLLADFMVQTAVTISEEQKECDYRPLRFVISSDIDFVLKNTFELDKLLYEKIYEKKLLPTIANEYISIKDLPKYSSYDFAEVLPPDVFRTLLKKTDDSFIEKYLNDLQIGFYEYEDFCDLLNKNMDSYSSESKVKLIKLIESQFHYITSENFPHLIVDHEGKSICDNSKVFLYPVNERVINLPEWVNIKFLNKEMEKLLYSELEIENTRRALVFNLRKYNLEEYSFDGLLRAVVAQANETAISKSKCSDILNWLWGYFNVEHSQSIIDFKVQVICRDGRIRCANKCYIGKDFGNLLGERLISLYSPDNFVSFNELSIDCADKNRVVAFLEWLGASKYPRFVMKELDISGRNRIDSGFLSTCYPLFVYKDNRWYSKNDFKRITKVTVGFFENLEVVLEKADFNDLLAWFISDDEIGKRLDADNETEALNPSSEIIGKPHYKSDRIVDCYHIKSYIKYYLSNTDWITADVFGYEKRSPRYCCFEEKSLSPFIISPHVNYDKLKSTIGRPCQKVVESILKVIGVADDFYEMDRTVIYDALLKLPELDPTGKRANSLYRKLIKNLSYKEVKDNNISYDKFIKEGQVLSTKNGTKQYVLVSDVRYTDKRYFSNDIINNINLLDLEPIYNPEKVYNLFGVKPLELFNVELEGSPDLHPLNEYFKEEYFKFIPFVLACRLDLKKKYEDFKKLSSSKVILCKRVSIRYSFGGETKVSKLSDYENIYFKECKTAYLCAPDSFNTIDEMRQNDFNFAEAIEEIINAILNLNENKGFLRDLFRENDSIRKMKMQMDKGDVNLELLSVAERMFDSDPRKEFWKNIAEIKNFSNIELSSIDVDKLICSLQLPPDIDKNINYYDLNSSESIESLIPLFSALDIKLEQYNLTSVHSIDPSEYWSQLIKRKMNEYKKKYKVFLYEKYQDDEDCVRLYYQNVKSYEDFNVQSHEDFRLIIHNSLSVDIDCIFQKVFKVTFQDLDKYDSELINKRLDLFKKISSTIDSSIAPQFRESYLIFGKINELVSPVVESSLDSDPVLEQHNDLKNLVNDVLKSPCMGFSEVTNYDVDNEISSLSPVKTRNHHKITYSEVSDRNKREIGILGEACVYRELCKIYQSDNVRWVSGNAEKAGHILIKGEGDDTCGYDMSYEYNGVTHYVEVKSSRSKEIIFYLSDNEKNFGCQNSSSYEIIYVVIADDGKSIANLLRLGNIFKFSEGEDFWNNKIFSVESDSYRVIYNNKRFSNANISFSQNITKNG